MIGLSGLRFAGRVASLIAASALLTATLGTTALAEDVEFVSGESMTFTGPHPVLHHACGTTASYDAIAEISWSGSNHWPSGATVNIVGTHLPTGYEITGSKVLPASWGSGSTTLVDFTITAFSDASAGNLGVTAEGPKAGQPSKMVQASPPITIDVQCVGGNNGGNDDNGGGNDPTPDTTPPVIGDPVISGVLGNNGWYTSDVIVSWTVTNPESSVTTSGCDTVTISTDTNGTTITCTATSEGGSTSKSVTIKRDATPPTIDAGSQSPDANGNGWNNTDVTVTWTCDDVTSGAASASVSETLADEGADQSATGMCSDNAGNQASSTYADVDIDKTDPDPTITTPSDGAEYILGQPVAADYACSDNLSGVASCDGTVASGSNIDTASVGSKSFSVTATDNADNSDSATNDYSVVYGDCLGGTEPRVRQPVNDTAHGQDPSSFKLGSTVPVKFRVCDWAGNSIGTAGVVQSFKLVAKSNGAVSVSEVDPQSTNSYTEFRYDTDGAQWIFNLATKSYSKSVVYSFEITLNSGQVIPFSLTFK